MGTVVTIDVRDVGDWEAPVRQVVAWLHHVDAVFSTYRPDSVISRIQRGDLGVDQAPNEVAEVLALCAQAEVDTGGYFTSTPGGRLDPTGLVKGWAIERASAMLRAAGAANHAINGGGDIQLAGCARPDRAGADDGAWRVGIVDPFDRARLLTSVSGRGIAVATSGTAERGPHIVDPVRGGLATDVASVTIVGPSLTMTDAYATAAAAMGDDAQDWLEALPGHEGFAVTRTQRVWATRGFPGVLPVLAP